jgi:hypothetical protein
MTSKKKRGHQHGDWPCETPSERAVVRAIRFVAVPSLAWGMNLVLPLLLVLLLWGTWQPFPNLCWSLVALAYALMLGIKGWKPWRMPMYRGLADGDSDRWNTNSMAITVAEFLGSKRIRWTGAAIIASAMLTPWLISGISHVVGGSPLRPGTSFRYQNLHPVEMMAAGYADGVRAGTLAAVWMTKELRKNWTRLREAASLLPPDVSA